MVRHTDATEIMAMEQELIDGGMRVEEVRHFRALASNQDAPGHLIDTFRQENAALSEVIKTGREIVSETAALADEVDAAGQLDRMLQVANDLIEVDKH
jgi:DUF438 domain-containing protein